MQWSFLWLPFALVLLAPADALAVSCQHLRPEQGGIGYQQRSNPDRCEGLYQALIAGERLELLSFLQHPIAFDPQRDKTLTITAPNTSEKVVTVVARALPLHVFYRMDMTIASGGSLPWPITTVIIPANLAPSDLGLVGTVPGSGGPVYVPLDVAAGTLKNTNGAAFVITFRAPVDLDLLQWRLYGEGAPPPYQKAGAGRQWPAGEPIPIILKGPSGSILTLDIAAKPAGGEYLPSRFQILLP